MKLDDWIYMDGSQLVEEVKQSYKFAFIGKACELDDRSKAAETYCQSVSEASFSVGYVDYSLQIQNENGVYDHLNDGVFDEGEIIVDATTIDVPELLKIIEWLESTKRCFDVCYFEPEKYLNKKGEDESCEDHYVISDDGAGINFIPPFVCSVPNSAMVVSLGFEGHRFGSIIESDEFPVKKFYALGGVPAFKFGMEKTSFLMNHKALEDSNSSILISGANDPVETYNKLMEIRSACAISKQTILLAPFGTKPVALAMCMFAVNNRRKVGIIYDFVQRRGGRSSGVGKAHVWSFRH